MCVFFFCFENFWGGATAPPPPPLRTALDTSIEKRIKWGKLQSGGAACQLTSKISLKRKQRRSLHQNNCFFRALYNRFWGSLKISGGTAAPRAPGSHEGAWGSTIPGGPEKTEQSIQSIFQDFALINSYLFFTLLDRASFFHHNNTKIIKFGWELFILWVISYGLSFSRFARFPEFRGTMTN